MHTIILRRNSKMANVERIDFESATLFKELVDKGQLKSLVSVKSSPYPKYCFKNTDKVADIVGKFVAQHNLKSDRSIDDCWETFDKVIVNAEEKPQSIVTRNLKAVKRIVVCLNGLVWISIRRNVLYSTKMRELQKLRVKRMQSVERNMRKNIYPQEKKWQIQECLN